MKEEIERKFLVLGDGFMAEAVECRHMVQGYICRESGRTVRVRIDGDCGFLTIKGRSTADGTSRSEWEYEIPVEEARGLLGLCPGKIIDKDRYIVPALSPENIGAWRRDGDVGPNGGEGMNDGDDKSTGGNAGQRGGGGLRWEVDVFHGAHEGLVIAEIELHDAAEPFVRPGWLGEEVTGDRRYYNSVLAGN